MHNNRIVLLLSVLTLVAALGTNMAPGCALHIGSAAHAAESSIVLQTHMRHANTWCTNVTPVRHVMRCVAQFAVYTQ